MASPEVNFSTVKAERKPSISENSVVISVSNFFNHILSCLHDKMAKNPHQMLISSYVAEAQLNFHGFHVSRSNEPKEFKL